MIGWRRTTLAVLLAVSLTLTMSACDESDGPPPAERITLVTPPSPSLAPLYVARAKGYFREDGLDVRLRRQGVGVSAMRDLLDGKADLAAVADPPIARAVLVGQEPVIIGTFDRVENLTYVVARRDRGIATVEDLAGKNVGVIRDNIGEYFLHVYLVTSGIDPDSVRVTYLEAAEMVPAVVGGRVDAISWAPPSTVTAQEQLGANAAVLQRPGLYTVTWYFVTLPRVASERSDSLARFLSAIDRANEFIETNPEEAQSSCRGGGLTTRRGAEAVG